MPGYRGYRARKSLARTKSPTRREILAAVPPGSVRLTGRKISRLYLDGLAGFCPELAALRADGRETHLTFARLLAAQASWLHGTTWHSRSQRCAQAARSESTWKASRRRLEAWGWLGTVRPGRIYWLGDEVRHDAAIYVLCIPKVILRKIAIWRRRRWPCRITRPPTGAPQPSTSLIRAATPDQHERDGPRSARTPLPGRPRNAELVTGDPAAGEMARVLRQAAGYPLSDGWCGWIARRFLANGWSPAELSEVLRKVPPRSQWDPVLRTLQPRDGLGFWLAVFRTPARHWSGPWQTMRPAPARIRRSELRAAWRENARHGAELEAARAAGPSPAKQDAIAAAMAAAAAARIARRRAP